MDIYEIVSGKEAKKMEKDRIVNFIELDPTIILFPIRIVKKDLSSFSVFELKCKSFDCEKYYLGEYLSQGILFFSDKQRNFKNIYQSYYKESDKSMFTQYDDTSYIGRLKLPPVIFKECEEYKFVDCVFTLFQDSFGCLQIIKHPVEVDESKISLNDSEMKPFYDCTDTKYRDFYDYYFSFIEDLLDVRVIVLKNFNNFEIFRGFCENRIDESAIQFLEKEFDKSIDSTKRINNPYHSISSNDETIRRMNSIFYYEISNDRKLNSFGEIVCIIEYYMVMKLRLYCCIDNIRNNKYEKCRELSLSCLSNSMNDVNYVFSPKHKKIAEVIRDILEIPQLLSSLSELTKRQEKFELDIDDEIYFACVSICNDPAKNSNFSEDELNRQLRDILASGLRKTAYSVNDQTQMAYSPTEKSAGEIDLIIKRDTYPFAIVESLIHHSKSYLFDHIKKTIDSYNQLGFQKVYIICYVKSERFDDAFAHIYQWINEYEDIQDVSEAPTDHNGIRKIIGKYCHFGCMELLNVFVVSLKKSGDSNE